MSRTFQWAIISIIIGLFSKGIFKPFNCILISVLHSTHLLFQRPPVCFVLFRLRKPNANVDEYCGLNFRAKMRPRDGAVTFKKGDSY